MEVVIREPQWFTTGPVQICGFQFPDGTTSAGYARDVKIPEFTVTQELCNKLISAGLKIEVGQPIAGFKVTVAFPNVLAVGNEGSIQLFGVDQFLSSLFGGQVRWLQEVKIQFKITQIVCRGLGMRVLRGARQRPYLLTIDRAYRNTKISSTKCPLFNSGQLEAKQFEVTTSTGDIWIKRWRDCFAVWRILGAVNLFLPRFIGTDPDVPDLLAFNRKMLTLDDDLADTTVIAKNGAKINFHRNFLAASSPVFERMFLTKMKEAASGVLELRHMTEESVRALKEYLYVYELKAPQKNPLVCFELFEAGHQYGISTLAGATSKILLRMDGAWYTAGVARRLYRMVRNMEFPDLMLKAVEILKLKRAELKTVKEYCVLSREEKAGIAKELNKCLAPP